MFGDDSVVLSGDISKWEEGAISQIGRLLSFSPIRDVIEELNLLILLFREQK